MVRLYDGPGSYDDPLISYDGAGFGLGLKATPTMPGIAGRAVFIPHPWEPPSGPRAHQQPEADFTEMELMLALFAAQALGG